MNHPLQDTVSAHEQDRVIQMLRHTITVMRAGMDDARKEFAAELAQQARLKDAEIARLQETVRALTVLLDQK